VAEEGNNEGHEGTNSSESTDSAKSLTSMHISTYEELKTESAIQADMRHPLGWAEAFAKDERAEKARNRVQDTPRSQRSWQSRRASYRAREDARRTKHGLLQKSRTQLAPQYPNEPYAKGWVDAWLDQTLNKILVWLRIQ